TVDDGNGGTDTATVTINVNPVNDAPVANDDSGTTQEDVPVTFTAAELLANDSDIDGDTLTIDSVGPATNGTVVLNPDGTVTFTPTANFNGTASFVYTVSDGNGGTDTATVTLTVDPDNDPPVVVGGSAEGLEDTPVQIAWDAFGVTDIDSPLAGMSIQIASPPSDGQLQAFTGGNWTAVTIGQEISQSEIEAGNLRFVPDTHESGDDGFGGAGTGDQQADYAQFAFVVNDGDGAGTSGTVSIDIHPVADAPTLGLGPTSVDLDGNFALPTGNGLRLDAYTNVPGVDRGTAVDAGILETILPTLTPDSSTLVSDLGTGSTAATAPDVPLDGAFRLTGLIYLEAGHSYDVTGYRDDTFHVEIGGTTVISQGHNNWGAYTATSFVPTETGYYTFEMYVYNGDGVGDVSVLIAEDGGAAQTLSNYLLFADTQSVAAAGGQFSAFVGTDDGGYYPVRLNEGLEDTPIQLQDVSAALVDTDGSEVLTVTASGLPAGATLSDGTNSASSVGSIDISGWDLTQLTVTPPSGFVGTFSFDVTATSTETSNGDVATTSLPMAVTVLPVNDAPVASGSAISLSEDVPHVFTWSEFGVSDVDSPDASLQVQIGALPANGTLQYLDGGVWVAASASQVFTKAEIDGGVLRFVPAADASNTSGDYASVSFIASDGDATSALSAITIDVAPAADAPTLHAHLSPLQGTGEEVFSERFSAGSGSISTWTRVQLFDNTYTEQPGSGKTLTESELFDAVAWNGQTSTDEWNSFWTVRSSAISSNSLYFNRNGANGSEDAHGMLAYQNLSVSDRALTSYSLSADMWGNTGSQQNNGIGLVFGYQDSQNYFLVRWENMGTQYQPGGSLFDSYPGQANQLSLVQMVNGNPVDLGVLNGFNTASWFNLRVEVTADGIRVYADDNTATYNGTTPQITYTYGSVPGGATTAPTLSTIGLWVFDNDAGVAFDNIAINAIDYTYQLDLQAFLNDTDGSETLSPVTLTNLPDGVTLTASDGSVVPVSGGSATIPVTSGVETTVTVHAPAELSPDQINGITASVTATELAGGSATTSESVRVELIGTGSGETLTGTAADEWIEGGGGNDTIIGGGGDDVLLGGLGSDTFVWRLADAGPAGAPAEDAVVDFNPASGGDVLDLRDLLQGENSGNLANYLHFEQTDAGTVVHVSSSGGFAAGYNASQENQSITLEGVDLFSGGLSTDQQVIQDLLSRGKLITD
ncbi:MAG: tandem-95 repeat protein, partial [Rhodocyclaceae bacterium]|nr:tandem-95 repeat protein [Rhodocyclaceae bacterium]